MTTTSHPTGSPGNSPAGTGTTTPQAGTGRWADLAPTPTGTRSRVKSAIAHRIFTAAVRRLHVRIELPDATIGGGRNDAAAPVMDIRRPDEFFARIGADGLIGFGESYMTGAWEAPDLAGLLTAFAEEMPTLVPAPLQRLRALYVRRPPRATHNTVDNTLGNIAHHYDLSNELFATFLDDTMSYSSALFETPVRPSGDHFVADAPREGSTEPFAEAQTRKIDRLLDEAGVGEGSRVLEIGTGWGELALRAAARGAVVRSVTLSREQQLLARERVDAAGRSERVDIDLLDYRQVEGRYDAIVSVEMIEAVGHQYWRTYFEKIDSLLAPGGRVGIQAITMPHDRMLATRGTWTWVHKYIFPGGFLPSVQSIQDITRDHTSLRVTGQLSMGQHYAETLHRWDQAFAAASPRVRELGFDEIFERMWHFYLDYSRAGFASSYLDVQQLTLTRDADR